MPKIAFAARKCTSVPRRSLAPVSFSGATASPLRNSIWCTLPSRQMVRRNHSESAFTTDTPTPCRPPDTLYEFESNLPPACSSVMTISAAERLASSSSLMPVGMPRPLSSTEIELSVWIVSTISSQYPARASSTALSTTSNTMWCRPVPSEVSPMYIPGRLRTASSPFRTLIESEPYSEVASGLAEVASGLALASGLPESGFSCSDKALDPHRHDDVLEVLLRGIRNQRARRSVAECALDLGARHIVQDVEQIIDVEPDIDRVAGVFHFQLLVCLFLLGVGGYDLQAAFSEHPAHPAEFLVREDRCAQQRLAQGLAFHLQPVLVLGRDHARVVRELAVDELRDQLDRAEAERRLSRGKLDAHFIVAVGEQLRELEHGFSRHDYFLAWQVRRELEAGEGEPMPVGGDELKAAILDHHEQPVQVIADILLRHGVLHQREQAPQGPLLELEARRLAGGLSEPREVFCRKALQRESASTRLKDEPLVLLLQGHLSGVRQCPQDVEELARSDRDRMGFRGGLEAALRDHLDLDVRREEREVGADALDQHVGQDRQRVRAFDDSAHCGKGYEDLVVLCLDQNHLFVISISVTSNR